MVVLIEEWRNDRKKKSFSEARHGSQPCRNPRRAAGLHHDPARRAVDEELSETLSRQALAINQATLFIADRQLENSLCQVNGDGGSVHGRTPSAR